MEIEIVIHTCLRDYKFTVNAADFPDATEEEMTKGAIQAWDEDHAGDEFIVVPDYFQDPDGFREAMEKLERKRAAKDNEPQHRVEIEIPSKNLVAEGITWGGLA
tara:strand:+ start:379 stop:690 length:312 start_codon:yes stop_codon:yes gene_type:complete